MRGLLLEPPSVSSRPWHKAPEPLNGYPAVSRTPILFISHGAPTFALDPGKLGARLTALGKDLSGVKAVLVVSPHWQTDGVRVMANIAPATLHDFGGFPRALYDLQYPARGHLQFAVEASRLLADAGFEVSLDEERGLDHGAWVPLLHLLPAADVPVFQVSMPHTLDAADALRLGRALAPLRQSGVLIVGSGSMTHNLYEIRPSASGEAAYVQEFTAWVRAAVLAGDTEKLVDYRRLAPHAARAHPTEEHFLPLLVAIGANNGASTAQVIEGEITYGVLSMESYAWE
jgi:4,5-DOPA dioxygenase extradiol